MIIERTKKEWEDHFQIRIIDPDGWLESGVPLDMPINEYQFTQLAIRSTINAGSELGFFRRARQLQENGGIYT